MHNIAEHTIVVTQNDRCNLTDCFEQTLPSVKSHCRHFILQHIIHKFAAQQTSFFLGFLFVFAHLSGFILCCALITGSAFAANAILEVIRLT